MLESNFPTEWYQLATEDHFWMDWRFKAICNHLPLRQLEQSCVADVGCGSGSLGFQLKKIAKCRVEGFDLQDSFDRKRFAFDTALDNFSVYDIRDRHPDQLGKFDFIFALDVLEHVREPIFFLEAAYAHLKVGGILVLNVPAIMQLYSRYDEVAGHYKRYTKKEIVQELKASKFNDMNTSYWGFSLVPLLVLRNFKVRNSHNVLRDGFGPPSAFLNSCLRTIGNVERKLLKQPLIGTSLIAVAKKL